MRLLFVLFAVFSMGTAIKCYDGLIRWGPASEEPGLTLKDCPENCCTVTWSMPGTIYSCGDKCPKPKDYINGEKCEQAPTDASWCYCKGPVGKCKPKA